MSTRLRRIAWLGVLMSAGLFLLAGPSAAQAEETVEAVAAEVEAAAEEAVPVTAESATALTAENQFAINNMWLLLCGALVFIMQLGFGAVESGFLPQKHTVNVLMKNTMDFGLGALVYFLIGFSIMYSGAANGWFGFNGFGIDGFAPETTYAAAEAGYSHYADWFFQVVFAAAAATIASGAMAGRTAFKGYLIATVFITGLIYPISGFWKWGGGWLDAMGFQDYAGSMVVHGCGGFIALAGALVLGPRIGRFGPDGQSRPIPGHSMPMAFIGVFILFFGWFGFNAGSELAAVGGFADAAGGSAVAIGKVCVTTALSAAAGAVAAMFTIWAITGMPDLGMALNGVLAGLVGITANCAAVEPMEAIIIGLIAGVIVCIGTIMLDKMRIDDPVGAFPVHGMCGIWGCMAYGFFGDLPSDEITRGSFIGVQLIGTAAIAVWAFMTSFVLFSVLKATIGLRATEAEELEGLDVTEHGAEAYPDYSLRIR